MKRAWQALAAVLILLLPWHEATGDWTGLAMVQTLALGASLAAPTLPPAPLTGGAGLGWLAALLGWGAVSALRPGYRFAALSAVWDQAVPALWLVALASTPLTGPVRRRLAALLVTAGVIHAGWSLILLESAGGRATGAFLNRNFLAAHLNIALPAALFFAGRGPGRRRVLAIAAAGILSLALFATGSRGGVLAALGVGALFAAARLRGWARAGQLRPRRVLAAAMLGALLIVAGGLLWSRVRDLEADPYRFHRLRIWWAAAAVAAAHPWAGVGAGQLRWVAPNHNFPLEEEPFRYARFWTSAHSQPLQLAAEQGLIGVALAGGFLICLLRALAARARTGPGGLAGAACAASAMALAHGLVDTPLENGAVSLSLATLAGLALAPGAPGPGSEEAARGGRSRRLCARAGLTGLAAVAVALWGAVVAPWAAHAAWLRAGEASDPRRAFGWTQAALRWNPHQFSYPLELGRALARSSERLSLRRLGLAYQHLERAAQLNPHEGGALQEQGDLLVRASDEGLLPRETALRAALRRYELAAGRWPLKPAPRLRAGLAALRLGDHARARAEARGALHLEPNFLDAHLLEADAALRAGDRRGARQALAEFRQARLRLASHEPRNDYERDLVTYNDVVRGRLEAVLR